ncbi:hypothetical protein AZI87_08845 [Bdellovibrio bacteriovorus]|uniref:Uncharacterized protein n=1 Tax=Bdellovibrio bacteriovorus TaxID=959 RepID=A0A162GZE3_BDEBC|nr:hypothetical protein [Bdellovibrio bacteriovorus]KYG69295.1 hypothetical protein AZI87_08845 [Bdellovibrio bacteriovorus]
MKTVIFSLLVSFFSLSSWAALPPQFSECLRENSATNMSVADLREIARVSAVTYCQNSVGLVGKAETMQLLQSPNINVGISVSKTTYSATDFVDLARAGSFVLYVDSARLTVPNIISIAQAGAQVVVMTASAGISKTDLLTMAAAKPFVLNVNSATSATDLRDYVAAGIQVVIRSSQSALSRADIMTVAAANSALVTVMP